MTVNFPPGTQTDIFTCEAFASPLPIVVSWTVVDGRSNATSGILLTSINDITITSSVEDNGVVSELRLIIDGNFHSPTCIVTNGNNVMLTQQMFERVASNTGGY